MATKAENRKTAIELDKELGLNIKIPATYQEENSEYWNDLVSDLKAKQRDASRETAADEVIEVAEVAEVAVEVEPEIEAPIEVAAPVEVEKPVEVAEDERPTPAVVAYCVKPGGSITSLKGILVAGMPIKAQDLSGDDPQSSFDNLIDKGYVVEVK